MFEVQIHTNGRKRADKVVPAKSSDHAFEVIAALRKKLPFGSSTYFTIKGE